MSLDPARRALDCLLAIMAELIGAARSAADGHIETSSRWAAGTLALHLTDILLRLGRIAAGELRPHAARLKPPAAAAPAAAPGSRLPRGGGGLRMPRHCGWIYPVLPDRARAIAADLRALLLEPGLADLLLGHPRLIAGLRPILRGLDLPFPDLTRRPPAPQPDRPPAPPPPGTPGQLPDPSTRPPPPPPIAKTA